MTSVNILKKISILLMALLSLELTRMGIGYLTILVAIGIIMPIFCGSKKSAVYTGILYTTLSYMISYPSSTFLIDYMPSESIPLTVSTATQYSNLFLGWIIPVIISVVICGIFSVLGYAIRRAIFGEDKKKITEGYYFEKDNDLKQEESYSTNYNHEYHGSSNSFNQNQEYPENRNSYDYNREYPENRNSYDYNREYPRNTNSYDNKKKRPRRTKSLNKKQKKELLYLTPIQKAKNRNENDYEWE